MKKYILALCVPFVLASAPALADCNAVGQKVAAKQHGDLVSSTQEKNKDGKAICVVVVSVASTQGEKPRRVELSVPLNK